MISFFTNNIFDFWFALSFLSTLAIDFPLETHSSLNFSEVSSNPIYSKY